MDLVEDSMNWLRLFLEFLEEFLGEHHRHHRHKHHQQRIAVKLVVDSKEKAR